MADLEDTLKFTGLEDTRRRPEREPQSEWKRDPWSQPGPPGDDSNFQAKKREERKNPVARTIEPPAHFPPPGKFEGSMDWGEHNPGDQMKMARKMVDDVFYGKEHGVGGQDPRW